MLEAIRLLWMMFVARLFPVQDLTGLQNADRSGVMGDQCYLVRLGVLVNDSFVLKGSPMR